MAKFTRRHYQSLADAQPQPKTCLYLLAALRYIWYRIFIRHKNYFATAGLISFLCGALYLILHMTNTIEARFQQKYTAKIKQLTAQNEMLLSENEILQNLRADFVRQAQKGNCSSVSAIMPSYHQFHLFPRFFQFSHQQQQS